MIFYQVKKQIGRLVTIVITTYLPTYQKNKIISNKWETYFLKPSSHTC